MKTSALASGSSGNCFFIESDKSSFLVDAGISCKQIVERMELLGKDASSLNGIFVTHEHSDHIRGIDVLSKKYSIPVFITKRCSDNCSHIVSDNSLLNFIEKDKILNLNKTKILPFSKNHDASDPVSYSIVSDKKKISVMTDVGIACSNIIKHTKDSNVIFLESNHDIDMLENGRYPIYLKRRIASDNGHLSNYNAALLVLEHASPKLQHVILSHLSENNNTQEIALKTIKDIINHRKDLKNLKIHLSNRNKPTKLISI
jgi:phosphoribosyl 1,2-cyclic phosphodiesterase